MGNLKTITKKIPVVSRLSKSVRKRFQRYRLKNMDAREIFTDIYNKNFWRGTDSVSGRGSEGEQVKYISQAIPALIEQFDISSMLDIPCGDFQWMKNVNLDRVDYTGADIVVELIHSNNEIYRSSKVQFINLNMLTDALPKVDLIFCRDCLVHFSFTDIFSALENVCKSESSYLLTTTFTNRKRNRDIATGQWRALNLQLDPFNLPEPLSIINEGCTEDGGTFADKSLALWKISDIQNYLPN